MLAKSSLPFSYKYPISFSVFYQPCPLPLCSELKCLTRLQHFLFKNEHQEKYCWCCKSLSMYSDVFLLLCLFLWHVNWTMCPSSVPLPPTCHRFHGFCCFILSLTLCGQHTTILSCVLHFVSLQTVLTHILLLLHLYFSNSTISFSPPASCWSSVFWRRRRVGRQSWAVSGKELIVSGRDKQPERASSTVYPSCQHST